MPLFVYKIHRMFHVTQTACDLIEDLNLKGKVIMISINFLAVLVSAVAAMIWGGLWYSPALCLKPWLKFSGIEQAKPHSVKTYLLSFALMLIAALVFAFFLGTNPPLGQSILIGFVSGFAWSATSFGINYAFSGRSFYLWLIDAGYHVGQFTLYGLILGAWH